MRGGVFQLIRRGLSQLKQKASEITPFTWVSRVCKQLGAPGSEMASEERDLRSNPALCGNLKQGDTIGSLGMKNATVNCQADA